MKMNKNFTKKIVSLASAAAIMGAVAVPAMAAAPADRKVSGTTNVFYSSDNFIPGPDGAQWGVKIPSGVVLSNTQGKRTGPEYGVKLVSTGANKDLNAIYGKLEVGVSVKSDNGYKLYINGATDSNAPTYSYQLGKKTFDATNVDQEVTDALNLAAPSQEGTFTLTKKGAVKGDYTDTLTFTFTEKTAEFKTDGK